MFSDEDPTEVRLCGDMDLFRDTYHGHHVDPYPYPCLCLCRVRAPCLGPGRRRIEIWGAFDCAWSATETAVKSGEMVLPSYVVCPASRICPDVPLE